MKERDLNQTDSDFKAPDSITERITQTEQKALRAAQVVSRKWVELLKAVDQKPEILGLYPNVANIIKLSASPKTGVQRFFESGLAHIENTIDPNSEAKNRMMFRLLKDLEAIGAEVDEIIQASSNTESKEGVQEQKDNSSFSEIMTAHGSVYKKLPDGRTQRMKTAAGELHEPQDVLVFIPPWDVLKDEAKKLYPDIFAGIDNQAMYEQILLEYAQFPEKTIRVIDINGKEIENNTKLKETSKPYLSFIDKNNPKNSFSIPVAKDPKIGYQTFDTRKFIDDEGIPSRERHIGNAVTQIS